MRVIIQVVSLTLICSALVRLVFDPTLGATVISMEDLARLIDCRKLSGKAEKTHICVGGMQNFFGQEVGTVETSEKKKFFFIASKLDHRVLYERIKDGSVRVSSTCLTIAPIAEILFTILLVTGSSCALFLVQRKHMQRSQPI